jgi:hypothetical protein
MTPRNSISKFVYMLIALTGSKEEVDKMETMITYFRPKPEVEPLTRLIAFFFGDSMEHEQPSVN